MTDTSGATSSTAVGPPVLSLAERDRRHQRTRAFMREHELDALVAGQATGRVFQYFASSQRWLSNEVDGQNPLVVFPAEGDPTLLLIRTNWGQVWEDERDGGQPWIPDHRLLEHVTVPEVLAEKGLGSGRIGMVLPGAGAGAYGPAAAEVEDPLVHSIRSAHPGIDVVDVTGPFSAMTLPKSPEEQRVVRRSAEVSDRAAQAFADAAGPGRTEIDMYAAAMYEFAAAGVDCQNIMFAGGNHQAGIGSPRWYLPQREVRPLRAGDVVLNEMFPCLSGIETQISLAVHIGEPSEASLHAHETCVRAHDAAMATARPGVSFHDVWAAMFAVVTDAGCWNWNPLIHSVSPMALIGQQHHDLERHDLDPAVQLPAWPPAPPPLNHEPLEEGTLFSVEPGAAIGPVRSRTGALVLITADGAECLTTVGTQLHVRT